MMTQVKIILSLSKRKNIYYTSEQMKDLRKKHGLALNMISQPCFISELSCIGILIGFKWEPLKEENLSRGDNTAVPNASLVRRFYCICMYNIMRSNKHLGLVRCRMNAASGCGRCICAYVPRTQYLHIQMYLVIENKSSCI